MRAIEVTPTNPRIAAGTTSQLTATAIYTDNTHRDVTTQALWSSANTAIATVSSSTGLAAAIAPGSVALSASLNGQTGSTTLAVTPATLTGLSISPGSASVAAGTHAQFTATGTFSDGTTQDLKAQVQWTTSNATVALIDAEGLATGAVPGQATVTASCQLPSLCGNVNASAALTVTGARLVSIAVTPPISTLAVGTTQQLAATGTYTDSSTQNLTAQVSWAASAPAIVSIDAQGLATAQAVGTTGITATLGTISSAPVSLTATPATLVSIAITPPLASVAAGVTQQFAATGTYTDQSMQTLTTQVTWASSNTAVATVSNATGSNGRATTLASGNSSIVATLGVVSSTPATLTVTAATLASLAVTPVSPSVPKGLGAQFTATGTYTDQSTQTLTTQVTWASSNTAVATVSNATGTNGQAATLATGTTSIVATMGSVSAPGTTLTVTPAALVSIAVTPNTATVPKGLTQQFTATGTYSDQTMQLLTTEVTWASSNTSVATISNAAGTNGETTTQATGTSAIAATLGSVVSPAATLTVTPAALVSIAVTPGTASVPKGLTQQFTATGTYSDQSTQVITNQVGWSSSSGAVASVSNATGSYGRATALATGSSNITANQGGKTSLPAVMTVTAAALTSITITPAMSNVVAGDTQQYTARGQYSDGANQDITTSVAWTSSASSIATISNSLGSQGLATSLSGGSTDIGASLGGVSASPNATLVVRPGVTFASVGAATWTAPAGVSSVRVVVTGAGGGGSADDGSRYLTIGHGGHGGRVTQTRTVTTGDILTLFVGGGGKPPSLPYAGGGGGGGATTVNAGTANQIIAGGGGGGGFGSPGTLVNGGNGGGSGTGAGENALANGGRGGAGGAGGLGGAPGTGGWTGTSGGNGNGGGGGAGLDGIDPASGGAGSGSGSGGIGSLGGGGGGGYGGGGGSGGDAGIGSSHPGGGGGGSTGPGGSIFSFSSNGGAALKAGGNGTITIEYLP